MTHHRPFATFAAGALAAVLIAGSFVLEDTSARAGPITVSIVGASFSPAILTVPAGVPVVWENNDPYPHTASSDAGVAPAFGTGEIAARGSSAFITFSQAGSYAYHCDIHPGMLGTIVVQAAAAATPVVPQTGTGLAANGDGGSPIFLPLFGAGATLVAASGALAFVAARRR